MWVPCLLGGLTSLVVAGIGLVALLFVTDSGVSDDIAAGVVVAVGLAGVVYTAAAASRIAALIALAGVTAADLHLVNAAALSKQLDLDEKTTMKDGLEAALSDKRLQAEELVDRLIKLGAVDAAVTLQEAIYNLDSRLRDWA